MALRDGYVECALSWRLFVEQVGSTWTGHLFSPLGVEVATWIGQPAAENVFESACTHLAVNGRDAEASQLRHQWEDMRS